MSVSARTRALTAGLIATSVWLAAPSAALACSVCVGTGNADTTMAYRLMTAFMTLTPMAIVGGVIYWIWRRYKALDAAEEAERLTGLQPRQVGDLGR